MTDHGICPLNPDAKSCPFCGFALLNKDEGLKLLYRRTPYTLKVCARCKKDFTEYITEEPHQQASIVKRFLPKDMVKA